MHDDHRFSHPAVFGHQPLGTRFALALLSVAASAVLIGGELVLFERQAIAGAAASAQSQAVAANSKVVARNRQQGS